MLILFLEKQPRLYAPLPKLPILLHKLSLFDKKFCYIRGKGRTGAASPGIFRKKSREIS